MLVVCMYKRNLEKRGIYIECKNNTYLDIILYNHLLLCAIPLQDAEVQALHNILFSVAFNNIYHFIIPPIPCQPSIYPGSIDRLLTVSVCPMNITFSNASFVIMHLKMVTLSDSKSVCFFFISLKRRRCLFALKVIFSIPSVEPRLCCFKSPAWKL